ncbi:Dihydrolipoamide dehydrogenase of 2-oxoglutarate dehydrogenase [Liberibacter crescens BT-1]|uniref:Dihydrolipoyl dehydrogenase n=1 Tax=Liberibacter crescens (strain BT-1) TaxID=1215343 RepID=L0EUU5_LIBCB|nr:dihydrolipoyl dehydrogenase [Liberibacter crescens]AGA64732.1 Dihydrolipoamide dehydrogenase of 2-oxoglutarate dehydrogenase [Liberibacter crescens BT-1]AMC12816.1 dihydrolipoamide dehydrogenase [Liberibacter crescens]
MIYDVVVIGAGPAGYVCAIKAAQLKKKVALIEKMNTYGGTCLNIGCIPSKALLHVSEFYQHVMHDSHGFGIEVSPPAINIKKMMAYKNTVVRSNVDGIAFLLKKNKIDTYHGTAKIVSPHKISVSEKNVEQIVEAKNIVVATGSNASKIAGLTVDIDEKTIMTSTGALSLEKVPGRLLVIGAGVIGLELGSVWMRLGSRVTVIEYAESILGGMDGEVCKQFYSLLSRQGMEFKLGCKVISIEKTDHGAKVTYVPVKGGESVTVDVDAVLIATGRNAYTSHLGLDALDIKLDNYGRIPVNDHFQTSVPNIYAIGDVVRGPMLAHKAEDEGIAVAEIIDGQKGHVNYNVIPNVVYTQPEVASVGKTEEQLKSEGIDYKVGKFPFTANGRARAMNAAFGLVKILADKRTDCVLGVHIIGHGAGEIIHEAAVLMEFGGSSEDLARICHAHPTLSEAVREASLSAFSQPIHM